MTENFPSFCFAENEGETVMIKKGEVGYYKVDSDESPDTLNEKLGIPKEKAEQMKSKSMFGW